MAKSKVQTQSRGKSSTQSSARSASKSKAAPKKSARSAQQDMGVQASFERARDYVGERTTLPNAGIALAGAGLLALVSTKAGRNLVRSAAEAVISFVDVSSIQDQVSEKLKPFKNVKDNFMSAKDNAKSSAKNNAKNQAKAQL